MIFGVGFPVPLHSNVIVVPFLTTRRPSEGVDSTLGGTEENNSSKKLSLCPKFKFSNLHIFATFIVQCALYTFEISNLDCLI